MSPHRRVTVTSPQTRLARARRPHRASWRPSPLDPADAERALAVYHVQRRRAGWAIAGLFAFLLGLPLALHAFPGLDDVRVAGVPVSWIAIATLPYPVMALLAARHLYRAEAIEDAGDGPDDVRGTPG